MIGVDIFAGAGGMGLGATLAGIDIHLAIEVDINAASTYSSNHPATEVISDNISNVKKNKYQEQRKS